MKEMLKIFGKKINMNIFYFYNVLSHVPLPLYANSITTKTRGELKHQITKFKKLIPLVVYALLFFIK